MAVSFVSYPDIFLTTEETIGNPEVSRRNNLRGTSVFTSGCSSWLKKPTKYAAAFHP